jgi:hypothetical protein
MSDLRPCPFCGGKPVVLGGGRNIHCGYEGCFMTSVWAKAATAERATECWNSRALATHDAVPQSDATRYQWVLDHAVILDESTEGLTILTIASDATGGGLSVAVERAIDLAMEKK